MNDSPGWASPGSSPSDPNGGHDGNSSDDASRKEPEQPPRKWSAEQPPPVTGQEWGSAPTSPRLGHQPGQPPSWGGWGGWSPPPAAKPGVIPLRPLGVAEILDGAVATARAHWRTALGVALGVAVPVQLASTIANGLWLRDNPGLQALENNPQPTADELLDAMNATLSSAGVGLLATLIGTVFATAMLTVVVSRAVLGRPVTMGDAWAEAKPRLAGMLGLTLLVMLIVTGAVAVGALPGAVTVAAGAPVAGSLLLLAGTVGGAVAGLWLWVRFCLAAPALMLERQGVLTAMRRSAKLVRNSWWRIFGIQALAWLLVQVVSFIVQIPASVAAALVEEDGLSEMLSGSLSFSWTYLIIVGIGAVVAMTVTLPLNAGITALLYMDQRIRREALDLELARAAGVDTGDEDGGAGGHGSGGGGHEGPPTPAGN